MYSGVEFVASGEIWCFGEWVFRYEFCECRSSVRRVL